MKIPPTPTRILASVLVVSAFTLTLTHQADATSIGVNFEGLESDAAEANLLDPTDVAGAVPAANWNNASGASGALNDLIDDSGAATPVDVTWTGQATWSWERSGDAVPAGGGGAMFNGYLDTTGDNGSHSITISQVPFSEYDVYVYVDGEHNASPGRPARINIGAGTDKWVDDTANWNGSYVEGTGTDAGSATANANYVRFAGQSGSTFTVNVTAETFRAAINGFQVVETVVTPGLPEIANLPASGITASSASARADLVDNGDGVDSAAVTFYWGTSDASTDAGAWQNSTGAGSFTAPTSPVVGNLGGLAPNTSYFYRSFVSNSAGDDWAAETETFTTNAASPVVENVAAADIGAFGATLGAMVVSDGGESPTVVVHYGEIDGGTGVWADSVDLGTVSAGTNGTAAVTGLISGTEYFFRASAENSAGLVWASASSSFSTTSLSLASVVTQPATNVTGVSANLKGEVTDDGGDPPVVSFYYGKSDGGTAAGAWDQLVQVGIDSGNFSKAVGNLDPLSTYFFRAHAQNGAGVAWAAESLSFDTPEFVAPTIVINEIHYDEVDKTLPGEFIELHNNSDNTVNLSGWYFSSGIDFVFPDGTMIAPEGYLVIAQDPATVASEFGFGGALGPWTGGLRNGGETVELRDVGGSLVDVVSYKLGFPWPTVGEDPSPSIELINPNLDNDLGGSWRSSGLVPPTTGVAPADYVLRNSTWSYHLGDAFPADGAGRKWNENGYDEGFDGDWLLGQAPIGFGDGDDNTIITRDHITVFLRKEFSISAGQIPSNLTLRTFFDDGIVVWINGVEVGRYSVDAGAIQFPPPNGFANNHEANDYEEFTLNGVAAYLVEGTNTIALQGINSSTGSSDLTTEAELVFTGSSGGTPTNSDPSPGGPNSVFVNSAPPALRQIDHLPEQPVSGQPVVVSIKATDLDGIGSIELEYQIVDPGDYIKLSDPRYQTGWVALAMNDSGTDGDAFAGDDTYSVTLPGNLQTHRRLVRYRINATDAGGASVAAPYDDDRQPNFAYFVYDGTPSWTGRGTPSLPDVTYDFSTIGTGVDQYPYQQQVPVYHLITTREEHEESQHIPNASTNSYGGSEYRWEGALVYDGEVYDHIRFRARGGVWRYAMGKNMWKFDFNRGRRFEARDNYGEKYATDWSKLNFSALIQQGNFRQRGEQGLFEWGGFKLHNLVGNPAPKTHFAHFRIVEHADENGPSASQYDDDFQGVYLVVEQMDGQFLEEHGLPDGNLYKMEGGSGDLNNQGPSQPSNKSDLNAFFAYKSSQQTVGWWQDNLRLDDYYSFRAIATAIHDYDIHANKNYFYFHDPLDDRWRVLNWDLDLTWTTGYNGGGINGPLSNRVLAIPEFARDYRNRMREILDLVFNDDQTGKILDECARFIHTPGQPSLADADRAMWDHNPIMTSGLVNGSKAGAGRYYEDASQRNFAAMINHVKDHIASQTSFINGNSTNLSNEAATIPAKPAISYTGGAGFPSNALSFSSGNFSDPQGAGTFGAMKWRVGEVYHDGVVGYVPGDPYRYEVEEVYTSAEISSFAPAFDFPVKATRPGRTYRARVRHMDLDGNWSHWSDPVEFVASAPDVTSYQNSLVISEFMYHPSPATGEEAALGYSNSDFEWIEVQNVSGAPIDMSGVRFTKGVDFDFPDGYMIQAGEYAIIARDAAAFASRHGVEIPVAGEYGPDNLSNGGENLKLSFGAGTGIIEFTYDDDIPWPTAADGQGFSLTLIDPASLPDHAVAANWRTSAAIGGTPGASDTVTFTGDPDADDDGDSFNRLLEYAFGSDDGDPSDSPVMTFATDGDGTLTLTLQKNVSAGDVSITVQKSADLEKWQPAQELTIQSEIPQGDGTALVTYSGAAAGDADRYFYRILVILD